jgi:4-amino-4-deoxy-L-arabinose transferase-like glycosyltransferase
MQPFLHSFFVYISNLFTSPKKLYTALVYALLLLFAVSIWWSTRYLPHHWDAAGFVINAAKDILDSNFTQFTTTHSDFAHPPFLMLLLAASWRFFSDNLLVSHLVMLPFVLLYPLATFSLTKKFIPLLPATVAAFTVAFAPYFLAEAGIVYIDLTTASLAILAFTLLYRQNVYVSLVVFSLAILSKETTLLLFPAYLYAAHSKKMLIPKIYYFSLPLIALALWFVYHYQVTGQWLVNTTANLSQRLTITPQSLASSAEGFSKLLFVNQYRWLLFIPALISLAVLKFKSKLKLSSQDKVLVLAIAIPLLFYIVVGEFAERYSLFFYPFLVIAAYRYLNQAVHHFFPQKSQLYLTVIGVTVSLASISQWYPPTPTITNYQYRVDSDLRYQDMILIFRQLSAYAQIQADESSVFYGAFPENAYLTQPYQGYVAQSVPFETCGEFSPQPNLTQYIILHPFTPTQAICRHLIDQYPLNPLTSFESNGKWIEIYVASPSAALDQEN